MKEIVDKYRAWSKDKDEDYIFDEIHEFYNSLDRGELYEIMNFLKDLFHIKHLTKIYYKENINANNGL